jgi:dethiobiotin synthetase
VTLAGWIANIVDPDFQYPQQTINYLMDQIKAPHMGTVPYQDQLDYQGLYQYISLPGL